MQRDGLAALSQETLDKYASLEDVWEEYYTQTYDYTFESIGFEEAFNTFSSLYKGCIKYEGIMQQQVLQLQQQYAEFQMLFQSPSHFSTNIRFSGIVLSLKT